MNLSGLNAFYRVYLDRYDNGNFLEQNGRNVNLCFIKSV